jgi:hypothetical protein
MKTKKTKIKMEPLSEDTTTEMFDWYIDDNGKIHVKPKNKVFVFR